MRKKIFNLLILLIISTACLGQVPKNITIVSSQVMKGLDTKGSLRILRPVFSHEGATLAADSANFDQVMNTFDAFGNVVITQSDGTRVYSDFLNYNGNSKLALLTRNVRLINGDATLTTDFLTYNMATKVGTYNGGGKIVNGQNVITSKNGYYFANSRDAYFRYNVVLTTPQAVIKTDTLRYNSNSKIAYFYGPTRILGKDTSVLYTENGTYNTITEQSRFGKKNLYTQGSKSLKGDSLFYDSKLGYGRAIKNITFTDTAQKFTFKGDIGIYRKADESILATKNAFVTITTESNSKPDSIWMAADTLFSKVIFNRNLKPLRQQKIRKDTELEDPQVTASNSSEKPDNKKPVTSTFGTKNLKQKGVPLPIGIKDSINRKTLKPSIITEKEVIATKADTIKKDFLPIDTLKKASVIPQISKQKQVEVIKKSKRELRQAKKGAKKLKAAKTSLKTDSTSKELVISSKIDSIKNQDKIDSALIAKVKQIKQDSILRMQDTSKTRIVLAYHHAKIFKSDLQSKADSMYFSYKDSTVRCYGDPIAWAQKSQLTADTIYIQLKNKKLDNMLLQHKAFIVNTEADSSKVYNQIKGKLISGFFRNNKLDKMFVDGNAESLYYVKEDSVSYTGLNHMISSRIKILFGNNQLQDIISIRKPEGNFFPIDKIPNGQDILDGFIWKPELRPKSKDEIIRSATPASKPAVKKPIAPVKPKKKTSTPVKPKKVVNKK